ncbi:MAG: hypothetical protein ACP59X_12095 [Solidesulfovibrio sp. DCME]|uniref:hypothetical protein n=1 Tax=Solidesulfovibrio sp. DCME TaxID=3447380 RepID=UPI003D0E137C
MAFTTWTALRDTMRADFASGKWRLKSYAVDDSRIEYHTPQEFLAALEFVEAKAASESKSYFGRTYARNGGRG